MSEPESPEVRERFEAGLSLVDTIARQTRRSLTVDLDLDDLVAFGRQGLWEAAQRFDESRGVPFQGFAKFRIRGAIIDGLRSLSHLPRRLHERLRAAEAALHFSEGCFEDVAAGRPVGEAASQAERALSDHLAGMATAMAAGVVARTAFDEEGQVAVSPDTDPEGKATKAQLRRLIADALAELPPREAELVRRHYLGGERFDQVAEELGLSKSWASRLHARAITRLTKRLRALGPAS